jgi:hypothetical protein
MSCKLCGENMVHTGTMAPNIGQYECGHSFHLNCILAYSNEKVTQSCPICKPLKNTFFANFGEDRVKAMQIMIDKRRSINKLEKPKSYFSLFSSSNDLRSMIKSGTSLSSLKLNGYMPESFIEEGIQYREIAKTYTMDSLIDFGFRFSHMLTMGFEPTSFKMMSENNMEELEITAEDMLKTSITIHDLSELGLEMYKLSEMNFTWADLRKIGGNAQTIRLITPKLSELKTYLSPTESDFVEAGFTTESLKKYDYVVDSNIFKKKVARRQVKHLTASNMLF